MTLPLFSLSPAPQDDTAALYTAAGQIAFKLNKGLPLTSGMIASAMTEATGGSDADGAWNWKTAYDVCEIALSITTRRNDQLPALIENDIETALEWLTTLQNAVPTQTRRSDEQVEFDQFSTPLPIAALVALAIKPRPLDRVLEPSCGTGTIAAMIANFRASVTCNELTPHRRALTSKLLKTEATGYDARMINHLDANAGSYTAIAMNPPFTDIERHLRAAVASLTTEGRLVALTYSSDSSRLKVAGAMKGHAHPKLIMALPQNSFRKHGTGAPIDFIVYDKTDTGEAPILACPTNLVEAAKLINQLPIRTITTQTPITSQQTLRHLTFTTSRQRKVPFQITGETAELEYATKDWAPQTLAAGAIYAVYNSPRITFSPGRPHPTNLVQSAAMASISPMAPTYKPTFPKTVLDQNLLSDAQLETIIYAGQAHSETIPGRATPDPKSPHELLDDPDGATYRHGFFCGDGTGVGKGRQASGIIMDNLCKGRTKAIWITKNETLLEDARRDWTGLGGAAEDVQPISNWQTNAQIGMERGILLVTYGSLRQNATEGRSSRLDQIIEWANRNTPFDGVMIIDESHALGNGIGKTDEASGRVTNASQQGIAGIALQNKLPDARVVYLSATGAETVENFAYATRLGLWGYVDAPFATREKFIETIGAGGVSALEILSRDLYALGLYIARNLSFEGVEYDHCLHTVTERDIEIYDCWADVWALILDNLNDIMAHLGLEAGASTSRQRAQMLSAFYSTQQRFFAHLLLSIQTPSVIKSMEERLALGEACVLQIVSTNEAIMERRLATIPLEEHNNLTINLTPVEYVIDYLTNAFPTQVRETITDTAGNPITILATHDGQPIISDVALEARDALLERIADLPMLTGSLDQIIQHFGADKVSEVTGRSRRIIKRGSRLIVQKRGTHANAADTRAFCDDERQILIFSDAGGTGRSYHADAGIDNKRRRNHYLVEPGFQSKTAIQGLGRTHRTNQTSAPIFRPVSTNIEGQKRFISTIAKRLESLGAATRGERRTGGNNLFKPEDAIEGIYANAALSTFYREIAHGTIGRPTNWDHKTTWIPLITLAHFQKLTGLKLRNEDGTPTTTPPPLQRFLARILALRVADQNELFGIYLNYLTAQLAAAAANDTLDVGMEDLIGDNIRITDKIVLETNPTGAQTCLVTVQAERPSELMTAEEARAALMKRFHNRTAVINARSNRVAIKQQGDDWIVDGIRIETVELFRPDNRTTMTLKDYKASFWEETDNETALTQWQSDYDACDKTKTITTHMVIGLLINFWKVLPKVHGESIRIRRAETADNETLLGRVISAAQATTLAKNYGQNRLTLSANAVFDAIMNGSCNAVLADKSTIKSSRVAGVSRCEIVKPGPDLATRLIAMGCFTEIIEWQRRYFIPLRDAEDVLAAILSNTPLETLD